MRGDHPRLLRQRLFLVAPVSVEPRGLSLEPQRWFHSVLRLVCFARLMAIPRPMHQNSSLAASVDLTTRFVMTSQFLLDVVCVSDLTVDRGLLYGGFRIALTRDFSPKMSLVVTNSDGRPLKFKSRRAWFVWNESCTHELLSSADLPEGFTWGGEVQASWNMASRELSWLEIALIRGFTRRFGILWALHGTADFPVRVSLSNGGFSTPQTAKLTRQVGIFHGVGSPSPRGLEASRSCARMRTDSDRWKIHVCLSRRNAVVLDSAAGPRRRPHGDLLGDFCSSSTDSLCCSAASRHCQRLRVYKPRATREMCVFLGIWCVTPFSSVSRCALVCTFEIGVSVGILAHRPRGGTSYLSPQGGSLSVLGVRAAALTIGSSVGVVSVSGCFMDGRLSVKCEYGF